jgi:hypothetical protein
MKVIFEGEQARAEVPGGESVSIGIADLLARARPALPDSAGAILPDGSKLLANTTGGCILVHQTTPRIHSLRWIANDSPAEYGEGTKYRSVRLSLPYLITFAVFDRSRGALRISDRNECFFTNQRLEIGKLDTPLGYPALLNCSKFPESDSHPVSWICTQYLKRPRSGKVEPEAALDAGLRELLLHTLNGRFNRSSENHEGASGFSATVQAGIDPRLSSVESWETATNEDPLFVLDIPWLPTGHTVGSLIERLREQRGRSSRIENAEDVARLMINRPRHRSRRHE